MAIVARDYQLEALEANRFARVSGVDKLTNVLASGLGKTILAGLDICNFMKEANITDPHILVLNGTNPLLYQIQRELARVFGKSVTYGFYNGHERCADANFTFANFASIGRHLDDFSPSQFDCVLIDEAHHSMAQTYRRVIEYFQPKYQLSVTATPLRMDGRDIAEICGPSVYTLELVDAIANSLTADVDYRLCLDEIERIQALIAEGIVVPWGKLNREIFLPKRDEEIVATVQKNIADLKDPTAIYFCRSIEHANRVAQIVPSSVVIHSELGDDEVKRRIQDFQSGKVRTVVSVDILNEGIDIPRTDVLVFLRSTRSWTVYLQQLGRGLRKVDGKGAVRVFDFVGSAEALERLLTMEQRIAEATPASERKKREHPHFELNLSTSKFQVLKVDIVKLLNEARELAELKNYTDEELLEKLRDLAKELGRTPMQRDIDNRLDMPCGDTYVKRFGSYNRALGLAGLEANRWRGLSDEELLGKLRDLAEELGRTPMRRDIDNRPDMPCGGTYVKRFGSYNRALELVGLKVNLWRGLSDEELLEKLRDLAKELGRTPMRREIDNRPDMPHRNTYLRRFGSYNQALELAGLEVNLWRGLSDEELLGKLRDLAEELGRTPTQRDIDNRPDMPCGDTYVKRFGSYNRALELAGLEANKKSINH